MYSDSATAGAMPDTGAMPDAGAMPDDRAMPDAGAMPDETFIKMYKDAFGNPDSPERIQIGLSGG